MAMGRHPSLQPLAYALHCLTDKIDNKLILFIKDFTKLSSSKLHNIN